MSSSSVAESEPILVERTRPTLVGAGRVICNPSCSSENEVLSCLARCRPSVAALLGARVITRRI